MRHLPPLHPRCAATPTNRNRCRHSAPRPGDTERILALVENAVRLLNAEPPQTNQARSVLYNALGKAEPWRTLRNEILNWKP